MRGPVLPFINVGSLEGALAVQARACVASNFLRIRNADLARLTAPAMSSTSSLHLTESDSWPTSQALRPISTVTFHSKLSVSVTELSVKHSADHSPVRSPAKVRCLRGRLLQHYTPSDLSDISDEHVVRAFHHREAGCCRQTLPAAEALGNNSDHALGAVPAGLLPSGPAACWR